MDFATWWNNRPPEVRYSEDLLLMVIREAGRPITFSRATGLPPVGDSDSPERLLTGLLFDLVVRRLGDMASASGRAGGKIACQAHGKGYAVELKVDDGPGGPTINLRLLGPIAL